MKPWNRRKVQRGSQVITGQYGKEVLAKLTSFAFLGEEKKFCSFSASRTTQNFQMDGFSGINCSRTGSTTKTVCSVFVKDSTVNQNVKPSKVPACPPPSNKSPPKQLRRWKLCDPLCHVGPHGIRSSTVRPYARTKLFRLEHHD